MASIDEVSAKTRVVPARQQLLADGVHLVGSVPLADASRVFRSVSEMLGPWVRRIPDGETGARTDWIACQYPVLCSLPEFEPCPDDTSKSRMLPRLRLRERATADTVELPDLGYARAAVASYDTFTAMKRDGIVPDHCRFQVSLPTPLAPVSAFIAPPDQAAIEPLYEARLLEELRIIVEAIPNDDLAIQWDANVEFGMLEGVVASWFTDVREGIVDRLVRLRRNVPEPVELGYHLCYGDEAHHHIDGPPDAGKLVDIANAVAVGMGRPLHWMHLPAPPDAGEPYFRPMADLALPAETELYLGLIHLGDGPAGAVGRMDAARRFVRGFGVATECGWGRQPERVVIGLLQLHAAVANPVTEA
jgi:hypothetical protein